MNKVYALGDIVRKTKPAIIIDTPLPNSHEYNASGVQVSDLVSGGPVRTVENTSSIVYSRRPKSAANKRRSNICVHQKHLLYSEDWRDLPPITSSRLDPPHAGWTYKGYFEYVSAYSAHVASLSAAQLLNPSRGLGKLQANWESYAATGFQALQPDLTQVSIPNFLIDIKQIGDLANDIRPFITRTAAGQNQLINDLLKVSQKSGKEQLRAAAKVAAGKRLSYKFGWKPTKGDLLSAFKAVATLRNTLHTFKELANIDLSFTKTLEKQSIGHDGTFLLNGDVHYQVRWRSSLTSKVQYHARYRIQPIVAIGPLDEKIRGYLDALGFELNPQIAWDAIPFSFVLDWFLNVGDWLSQFKIDALHIPVLLSDSSVDYKEEYEVTSKVAVNPNGYPTDVSTRTLPAGYVTHDTLFHRMPVDPSLTLLKSLKWKNPTGSQWTNLVSLATVLGL
jgi:hypothetical protein